MTKLFKRISAVALTAVMATTMAITASAVENYGFTLNPSTSVTRVMTEQKFKEDYEDAVVNLQSGLKNDYVTFRIRTPGNNTQPASNYVDADSYRKYYLAYWSGYGNWGDYYSLAASYDEGQSRSGASVSGIWAP